MVKDVSGVEGKFEELSKSVNDTCLKLELCICVVMFLPAYLFLYCFDCSGKRQRLTYYP